MNDRAMTKDDLIWVVIRGAGFVLLLRAVLYIPELVGAIAWNIYFGDTSVTTTEGERMSLGVVRHQLISTLAYLSVYAALGLYLIRSGAWIHRLLRFVTPERSNNTPYTGARDAQAPASDGDARAGERGS